MELRETCKLIIPRNDDTVKNICWKRFHIYPFCPFLW